ncbi:MAG: LamG domain-containing protein [Verrucomicrobia bacterium]|jgi:Concanavalin A-like lectin/glucanases superfamily|nr:MAG: LamG domain-containing protein [Verrucomicrobiota bacterium]
MKTPAFMQFTHTNPTQVLKSRLQILAALISLTTASIAGQAAVLAHWNFNESSGTVANDGVGSYSGTLSPNGSAFVSGGISGNAISLDRAANGFVNMGNVLGLTLGNFSVVAWMKMNAGDTSPDTVILGKHQTFSNNGYFIAVNATGGGGQVNKAIFYEGTIAGAPVSSTSVNDGAWHQIIAVYQAGGNKSIYVDGTPAESTRASQVFLANSSPFLIGGTGVIPEGRYTGLIDEVQIYNEALSPTAVNFLFQNPNQVVPEPGGVAMMSIGVAIIAAMRRCRG